MYITNSLLIIKQWLNNYVHPTTSTESDHLKKNARNSLKEV